MTKIELQLQPLIRLQRGKSHGSLPQRIQVCPKKRITPTFLILRMGLGVPILF